MAEFSEEAATRQATQDWAKLGEIFPVASLDPNALESDDAILTGTYPWRATREPIPVFLPKALFGLSFVSLAQYYQDRTTRPGFDIRRESPFIHDTMLYGRILAHVGDGAPGRLLEVLTEGADDAQAREASAFSFAFGVSGTESDARFGVAIWDDGAPRGLDEVVGNIEHSAYHAPGDLNFFYSGVGREGLRAFKGVATFGEGATAIDVRDVADKPLAESRSIEPLEGNALVVNVPWKFHL